MRDMNTIKHMTIVMLFAIIFLVSLPLASSFSSTNLLNNPSIILYKKNFALFDNININNRRNPKTNRDKKLSKMLESVDYNRVRSTPPTTLLEDPLVPLVYKIVKAADSRKASDIAGWLLLL